MTTSEDISRRFDLSNRVAVITGGSGLLGEHHRLALESAGATVVSLDLRRAEAPNSMVVDVSVAADIDQAIKEIMRTFSRVDILINNAANNPQVAAEDSGSEWTRLESFSEEVWNADIRVGLTSALLMSQRIGPLMAKQGRGVIVNVCSDLAVIAPDQRLYQKDGVAPDQQPVKPVSYSVVKHGLLGLTRYLATYWAGSGVRANAISPGGVQTDQPADFVARLEDRIPLGRMARVDEYEGALLFLCSDASSYLNGHNLVVDGGRTSW